MECKGGAKVPFFRYDFPDLNLAELSTYSNVAVELTKIKTPIDVTITLPRQSLELGEVLSIEGQASPPTSGLRVNLLVREVGGTWSTIATSSTDSDGSFTAEWKPSESGEYEVKAYCAAGEYTTEASSNVVEVSVTAPPGVPPEVTFPFLIALAIFVMAGAVIIIYLKLRKPKRVGPPEVGPIIPSMTMVVGGIVVASLAVLITYLLLRRRKRPYLPRSTGLTQ